MSRMAYSNLLVFKESFRLAKIIYQLTDQFPKHERYGLVSQMRRAAVSVPSNIAEGSRRGHKKEFLQFCNIAFGSASELEVQLSLSKELGFAPEDSFSESEQALTSTLKLLCLFRRSLLS
jgi:four helix bundle protein